MHLRIPPVVCRKGSALRKRACLRCWCDSKKTPLPEPHIAEEALNGIGRLNVSMHRLRKLVKRQQVLFILSQASYRFWIALSVLGFEGGQVGERLLLTRLLPDAHELSLDGCTLSSGDRIEHGALLMHQTALTRGGGKEVRDRSQQPIMPVRHDE